MKTLATRLWRSPDGNANRGQTLVLVAVMMTALLGITALSIDTGRLWMARRALQNSVDAAALAGAWSLPDDIMGVPTGAFAVACDYGTVKNAVPGMRAVAELEEKEDSVYSTCGGKANVEIPSPYQRITVMSEREMVPTLGSMFGWPSITVSARATAAIGSIHTLCVFPLFQTQDTLVASGAWNPSGADNLLFNEPMVMKTTSSDNESGNFLFLQIPGDPGGAAIRSALGSPGSCSGGEVTDTATTKTGNTVGPLDQGMADRRDLYMSSSSPGFCPDESPRAFNAEGAAIHPEGHPLAGEPLTPGNCYRLVQFPLLEGSSTEFSGTTTAKIRGFLTFYISNWCGQSSTPKLGSGSDAKHCAAPAGTALPELKNGELWGYYLKYDLVTDQKIQAYDGLGTKVVVLIE